MIEVQDSTFAKSSEELAVQRGKLKKKKEEEKELQEELKLRLPSGELDELNQKNNKITNRINPII